MTFDIPTLIVVTVFISSMAGGLMVVSWLQNRSTPALVWWGAAYLLGAIAAALLGARGMISDFWSINIANALLIATGGLTWCGLRVFDSRPVMPWCAACGSMIWLAACGIDVFYQSLQARISLGSVLAAVYAALSARELWRSRHDGLISRWLALGLISFHGFVFLSRAGLAWMLDVPPQGDLFRLPWLPFGIFEALFYAFGSAFILLTMTKERAEARHRHASLSDPLTGVPNRRGFLARAEMLLRRCRLEQRPVTVLLFDLDHFKSINDTFGHLAGDEFLVSFCRAVQSRLGPDDAFGRLGGEEFVCLMPGTTPQSAFAIAERIRADIDAGHAATRAGHAHATVSIGMANSVDAGAELTALLGAADKALYRAKAKGRNRVEWRRPPFALVAGGGPAPRGAA